MKKILLVSMLVFCKLAVFSQATSQQPTVAAKNNTDTTTFFKVEIESEFPGGAEAWRKFLEKNLSYPSKAARKGIEGMVVLQFIVCTDGTVCDIEAISGPEELRKSAVDALKKTPKWNPAVQSGVFVKSYKKQPIVYRLPAAFKKF